MWFVWDGISIYFITRRDMQKAKNLAGRPQVIIHAGDGDDVIILEGTVVVVTDPGEQKRIDATYGEKYVAPRTKEQATIFEQQWDLYCVQKKHVIAWEYRDVRTRTDWHF